MKVVAFLSCSMLCAYAKNFGVSGEVFPVKEESLLEVIEKKLSHLESSGTLETHQKQIQKRVQENINRPRAVPLITKATQKETYTIDPSITVPRDLANHERKIFVKAGSKVNPLNYVSLTKPLIFIDGDDNAQVMWALSQEHNSKIILVKGAPLELNKHHQKPFYFDQEGRLCKKLKLLHVPAKVIQEGSLLRITIEVLEGEGK